MENTRSNKVEAIKFVANRNDGLGERLRAVLNASVAARVFGGQMLLDWQKMENRFEYNDVLPIKDTFSQEYLDSRHVSRFTIKKLRNITTVNLKLCADFRHHLDSDVDAIIVDQRPLWEQFTGLEPKEVREMYKNAFKNIVFAPELEKARKIANNIALRRETVALHLRAGDVIYGRYRALGGFTRKVIPYPLVELLICRAKSEDRDVLIFGQDKQLCKYLVRKYDLKFAGDISQAMNLNRYQAAIFEICLMSRCSKVHSGGSGFAVLASWIQKVEELDLDTSFQSKEIIDTILESVQTNCTDVSDLQKSFVCYYLLRHHENDLSHNEKRTIVEKCMRYDPHNPLYQFIAASFDYIDGRFEEAEYRLMSYSQTNHEFDLSWSLKYTSSNNMVKNYLGHFEAPAHAGYAMAAICLAIREQAMGNTELYEMYRNIYLQRKGKSTSPLELDL